MFYCKDAFEGLAVMDQLIDEQAREALVEKLQTAAREFRERPVEVDTSPPSTDASVRSAARTDAPVPEPPFWGVREIPVDLDEVYPHLDTHVLFKLHWGGRGKKGEEWQALLRDDFRPRLERMWGEQTYLHPRALLGFFPCYALGNEIVVLDPEDRTTELDRLVCPAPGRRRADLPGRFLPPRRRRASPGRARRRRPAGGHRRQRGHRAALTPGGRRRIRRAAVRPRPRGADRRGAGRVAAQRGPADARHLPHPGTALLLGLPGDPRPERAPEGGPPARPVEIGMTITDGYAPDPEQSTLALVAHHPQAIYFGSRQGRLPAESSPDEVIAGSPKDPTLLGGLDDSDPPEEQAEDEEQPALAG